MHSTHLTTRNLQARAYVGLGFSSSGAGSDLAVDSRWGGCKSDAFSSLITFSGGTMHEAQTDIWAEKGFERLWHQRTNTQLPPPPRASNPPQHTLCIHPSIYWLSETPLIWRAKQIRRLRSEHLSKQWTSSWPFLHGEYHTVFTTQFSSCMQLSDLPSLWLVVPVMRCDEILIHRDLSNIGNV